MRPILATSDHGTKLRIVGDTIRVLATLDDTSGKFEAFETTGPRGSGPPPHAHPWSESYFIAEGEVAGTLPLVEYARDGGGFVYTTDPSLSRP